MSISQNAIESITMLIDYSAELEDQKAKLESENADLKHDNKILLDIVAAAFAWADLDENSTMDESILIADRLSQAVNNLKMDSSSELLERLKNLPEKTKK